MKIEFPRKFNIQQNIALKDFTKIRIGGNADCFTTISNQEDFVELMNFCYKNDIRTCVLGHGSNVFFSDEGFHGLITIIQFDKLELKSENTILAEAGASLSALNELCIEKQLTGFEFSSGIPGTVGGAIFGNAGAYGKAVGDCMTQGKILTPSGELKQVKPDFFDFAYRYSSMKINNSLLLEAEFKFEQGDQKIIIQKVNEILEMRHKKLPPDDVPTAGSYFKNIKDENNNPTAAGKLLDTIGSKQTVVGDIAVFHKHANIFYNKGCATANDLLQLEDILKKKVFEKYGIMLEREVMYFE